MAQQPSLILGTAGHIDHGKSSLICALTGTDPDRLIEEKRRGITIELGFAQLSLPSGRSLGVVDVPGHEKFVRQMVAGATGVDLALLVIAADDGVMPQTVEHLAILQVLGVKSCVVALTKIDLVDEDWVEFMSDEVAARLEQTPFANAPIIPVSSRTGDGLNELKEAIDEAAAKAERTKPDGPMRLPVDRVFTIKGHGTVVTGTLWSGTVNVGDTLEVLPKNLTTRVRSIQMHGSDCQQAAAGNRVALNLNGLSTEDIRPGDFLAAPKAVSVSDRFDARLNYLDPFGYGKPFETGSRVHVAHGTREVIGRVLLTNGAQTLRPGESALVQIRLEEPLPLAYQDRFIIRSYSPVRVLGGGSVLNAHPRRRTNLSENELTLLDALENANPQATVDAYLSLLDKPTTSETIIGATGLSAQQVEPCVKHALEAKAIVSFGPQDAFLAKRSVIQKIASSAEQKLMNFHMKNPNAAGMTKDELRLAVSPALSQACFDAIMAQSKNIVASEGLVSHATAGAGARLAEQDAANRLLDVLEAAGTTPPETAKIIAIADVNANLARKVLNTLVKEGKAHRVEADRIYSVTAINQLSDAVKAHIEANGPSPAADLKDAMGVSRKYAMPLLEYFDSLGITKREGDLRSLLG